MTTRGLALAGVIVLITPFAAAAQGPMIVERVQSGFVAAPDVKVTELDNRALELVGGNLGWVVDQTVFVGGGGYWLANGGSGDREMGYGGFVVQWLGGSNGPLGWGLKALIGGGTATLPDTITETIPIFPPVPLGNGRFSPSPLPGPTYRTVTEQVRIRDDFFVAEPEADLRIRLASHLRLTAGIGYRAATADRRDDSRLRGAVGSLGIQLGGGL